ncbi:Pycsar system effector family protein [Actinoplanes rectilineatus]|uniref:Pycsar system effector family protein n=1 Tax=Actinoplanes rectilineatus TaxID=113571 RepID=UPI000AED5A74|nr:Pycsar system effector family protein [Actinoplanes rectilineatus]
MTARERAELAESHIVRGDTKASIVAAFALGLASLGKGNVHGPLAVVAGVLVLAALVMALLVILPRLGGRTGIALWADARSAAVLEAQADTEEPAASWEHLHVLARIARRKYRLIQVAILLLAAAALVGGIGAL